MSDEEPFNPLQRRGTLDEILLRQLDSEQHYFRVIGELRYLLRGMLQADSTEAGREEFTLRSRIYLGDPRILDKVTAQRLLRENYRDMMGDRERLVWLEDKFREMDPADSQWLGMRNQCMHEDPANEAPIPKPGSATACLIFIELCHECDKKEKTLDLLVKHAAPVLLDQGMNAPPVPPPKMDARLRHMQKLEEDPEYRDMVESSLGTLKKIVTENPELISALRDSLRMTQFIGFPDAARVKEDHAVMQEEVEALLHAVESGEIGKKDSVNKTRH
ncbi:MAG: hypothetical protein H7833_11940 [Magnetococcus sp. DMHC-1]|nr:hypothetical protein [Magnetococcales bacterium]